MMSMLAHEWRAHIAILKLAIRARTSQGGNVLSWLLFVLAASVFLLGLIPGAQWSRILAASAAIHLLLCMLWWALIYGAILAQSRTPSMFLAPGMRRRPLTVLLVLLILFAVVPTLQARSLLAELEVGLTAAIAAPAAAYALAAAFSRYRSLAAAFSVLFYALLALYVFGNRAWLAALPVQPALLVPALPMLVALWAIFEFRELGRMRDMRPAVPGLSQFTASLDQLHRMRQGSRRPRAARTLTKALGSGNIGALLLSGLGPLSSPWTGVATGLSLYLWLSYAAPVGAFGAVFAYTLFAQGMFAYQLNRQLMRTRAEQALLRLAGRAPASASLNGVLAAQLVKRFGSFWLLTSALCMAVVIARGAEPWFAVQIFTVLCLTWLAVPGFVRDYAHGLPGVGRALWTTGWRLAVVALALLVFFNRLAPGMTLPLAVMSALAIGLALGSSVRSMVRAHPVFPVALVA